jgi:hypothetical protein
MSEQTRADQSAWDLGRKETSSKQEKRGKGKENDLRSTDLNSLSERRMPFASREFGVAQLASRREGRLVELLELREAGGGVVFDGGFVDEQRSVGTGFDEGFAGHSVAGVAVAIEGWRQGGKRERRGCRGRSLAGRFLEQKSKRKGKKDNEGGKEKFGNLHDLPAVGVLDDDTIAIVTSMSDLDGFDFGEPNVRAETADEGKNGGKKKTGKRSKRRRRHLISYLW